MYPFSHSVTPAIRNHLDAQTAFINDMSKSLFRSFQQMCDLNIQLTQTLIEESTLAGQQLLTADRQSDVIGAAASRAQPATEKLRAYQQHISRVAADAQVELARVTEQHVQETSRTARALADEVARTANEESERNLRTQQETIRKFSDPFRTGDGGAFARNNGNGASRAGASMQSAGQGSSSGGSQSDLQSGQQGSNTASTAGQTGQAAKPAPGTRKDA
jgi:phasin family protein